MRSVLAASDDCIKVISLDGALSFMSEGGQRVMEVSDFNAIKGCPWPDFWAGQGHGDAVAAIEAARSGRSSRFQGAAHTAAGNPRFWDVQVSPIIGPDGGVESILSVSRDITALKEAENRQQLLALELSHRIKNVLALVQSIANQTLKGGAEISAAKRGFDGRLQSLSSAQDLLTQSSWTKADLGMLVEGALAPHAEPSRFSITGADTELSSKCALALALALHELATNAAKYGALSTAEGRIAISWTLGPQFHLVWQESGGPVVSMPTHKGFGSRMIERALSGYFQGKAAITYEPSGIRFDLTAPVEALTEQ